MFFNRNKTDDRQHLDDSEMTPGIKAKIDDMVAGWSEVTRGLRDANPSPSEPPLQIIRKADVDYFMQALEAEARRVEDEMDREIADRRRQHQSEIAQRDAQIAALNRDIERTKARIQSQDSEIERRAEARSKLLSTVAKIDPTMDTSAILKDSDIRREVVRRKFGDSAVQDRSEAYVDERFESLEARVNVDPFARVVADGLKTTMSGKDAADKAWLDMVADMNTAHRKH